MSSQIGQRPAPSSDWWASRVGDRLLPRLADRGLIVHSLLVVHRGRLVEEAYRHPYGPQRRHRLYSAGKSLVSLAVGMLVDDGAVRLEDRALDHLGGVAPAAEISAHAAATTVEDLLTMRTPHVQSPHTQVADVDWVRSFFTVPPTRPPGTLFSYDTTATVVLTAIVERISGMPIETFLAERLGRPLGFMGDIATLRSPLGLSEEQRAGSPPWREVAENPAGVGHGGSGLSCTPRDLARVALLCLRDGVADGEQVVSADYLRRAVAAQVPTVGGSFAHPEAQHGYGYQFWRCRRGAVAAWGMGGQLMLCVPDLDVAVVVTGDSQHVESDVQLLHDALWEELLDPLAAELADSGTGGAGAAAPVDRLVIPDHPPRLLELAPVHGEVPAAVGRDAAILAHAVEENGLGVVGLALRCGPDSGELTLTTADGAARHIPFGIGHHLEHPLPGYGYETHSSAGWLDDETLLVRSQVTDEWLAQLSILLHLDGSRVVCRMRRAAEFFADEFEGVLVGQRW